jgi:hypothetical protein
MMHGVGTKSAHGVVCLAMSKANRNKGQLREKWRFICWNHEFPGQGPVRFKHEESRKDWESHNRRHHYQQPNLGMTGDWVHQKDGESFVGGQEISVLR